MKAFRDNDRDGAIAVFACQWDRRISLNSSSVQTGEGRMEGGKDGRREGWKDGTVFQVGLVWG